MQTTIEKPSSWLDRPLASIITLNLETVLFATILIVAILSRFYILGDRVMSHDENSHVYFSWLLSTGKGYQHDPVTHGPFQFHIVALTYFLFGDSDLTARIPAALFGILAVFFIWKYRRYLGRVGTLLTALFFTISPYILYYDRYVRNEAFVVLEGLVMLWAVLRYFETGKTSYFYWLTVAIVMHFDTKETSYIYVAQLLLFLGIYLLYNLAIRAWPKPTARKNYLYSLLAAITLLLGAGLMAFVQSLLGAAALQNSAMRLPGYIAAGLAGLAGVALLAAAYFVLTGYTLKNLRRERGFNLLMLVGTLILPLLTAFVINILYKLHIILWAVPTNLTSIQTLLAQTTSVGGLQLPIPIIYMLIIVMVMFILTILIGLWWNPRQFTINFILFYALFTLFYTTLFTNGDGFFTGLIGSLGYWLAQQDVNRGSQPWYFYALIQVPMYEYLPALGSLLAGVLIVKRAISLRSLRAAILPQAVIAIPPEPQVAAAPTAEISDQVEQDETSEEQISLPEAPPAEIAEPAPFLPLIGFWAITSLAAYSVAGEKMPWLTVHITLPLIILAGWALGQVIETTDWKSLRLQRGLLVFALLVVFFISILVSGGTLLGADQPFQGKDLAHLSATTTFLVSLLAAFASGIALVLTLSGWKLGQVVRFFLVTAFGLLAVLTARTAYMASYINYDRATEYLVYAHCGPGIKEALAQIEELSLRTTGGLTMDVAYDDKTSYPFWWYLRNYPNQHFFGNNPTRDLRQYPAILVGDSNYAKVDNVLGQNYYYFDYIRMWWPNQDYFFLDKNRFFYALTNPDLRAAIFQIWLNRDYSLYGKIYPDKSNDLTLTGWQPSEHFRLYLRKDVAAQLWRYGVSGQSTVTEDPYKGKQVTLTADTQFGSPGNQPSQFTNPHGLAVAPDGSLYVADSGNHRIQHLDAAGTVLQTWGSFADISKGAAPGGTFNEPWGVAVGPDGSVYVADTWNYRIQKFTAEGKFLTMWGTNGQAETPTAFWGPRDVAVNAQGQVFVTDTGNKRIVVFDANGNFITQFGSAGSDPGQFNEPVGVAIDAEGKVYVADTWNGRVQVFEPDGQGGYKPSLQWDVDAWFGQSVDNKPYIAVNNQGHVFITHPEGFRIIEFDNQGKIVRYWGDYGNAADRFTLPIGIAADLQGNIWVSDSPNGKIMHFILPK